MVDAHAKTVAARAELRVPVTGLGWRKSGDDRGSGMHGVIHSAAERELAKHLATFSTMDGCTKDDLLDLAHAGEEVVVPDAWAFVREGEAADACYVLLSGAANVFHGRHLIARLAAGAVIGEMAYSDGGQRHATVSTQGRVRALRVEYPALHDLLERKPRLKAALSAAYREHLAAESSED